MYEIAISRFFRTTRKTSVVGAASIDLLFWGGADLCQLNWWPERSPLRPTPGGLRRAAFCFPTFLQTILLTGETGPVPVHQARKMPWAAF